MPLSSQPSAAVFHHAFCPEDELDRETNDTVSKCTFTHEYSNFLIILHYSWSSGSDRIEMIPIGLATSSVKWGFAATLKGHSTQN